MDKEIYVFGDRFEHRAIIHKPVGHDPDEPKSGFGRRYDCYAEKTGAPFIAKTINYALTGEGTGPAHDVLKEKEPQVELVDIYEYTFRGKTKTKDEKRTLRRVLRYFADLQGATARLRPEPTPLPVRRERGDPMPRHRVGVFVDYNVDFHRSYLTDAQREDWRGSSFRNLGTVIIAIGDNLNIDCVRHYNELCRILLTESAEQSLEPEQQADSTVVILKLKTLQSAGIDITDATTVESCVEQVQIAFGFIEDTDRLQNTFKPSEIALALLKLTRHLIIIMDNGTFYLGKRRGYIQFMPNFKRSDSTYVANELGVYISSLVAHALADRGVGDVERVNGSIRLALLAYSHLFNNGIGPAKGDDLSKWSPSM